MITDTRPTAGTLNEHLASGGVVQVTTYTRSVLYTSRHVGWFADDTQGNLRVKFGRRGSNQLSIGERLLVGIRLGRYVAVKGAQ